MLSIDVQSLAETSAFGQRLGALLFPGAVVALVGPLGAGKTHLVRAIAEGLGLDEPAVVTSPTFVLIQEYEARLPIYHFDAYRLGSEREFHDLGCHEYFRGQGVCLVEWADRVESCLPAEYLRIEIKVTGPESRRLSLQPIGADYETVVNKITFVPSPLAVGQGGGDAITGASPPHPNPPPRGPRGGRE